MEGRPDVVTRRPRRGGAAHDEIRKLTGDHNVKNSVGRCE